MSRNKLIDELIDYWLKARYLDILASDGNRCSCWNCYVKCAHQITSHDELVAYHEDGGDCCLPVGDSLKSIVRLWLREQLNNPLESTEAMGKPELMQAWEKQDDMLDTEAVTAIESHNWETVDRFIAGKQYKRQERELLAAEMAAEIKG